MRVRELMGTDRNMASKKQTSDAEFAGGENAPAWADGLKQLYDDVVDEPLPDAFKDLLAQLDDGLDERRSVGAPRDNGRGA